MRQVIRLVRYVLPFLLQLLPGIFLLAAVGFLEAFRLVLLKPVLDRVLAPSTGSENIVLFTMPQSGHPIYLQRFVPTHFHNAWTIVAYALVASTVLSRVATPVMYWLVARGDGDAAPATAPLAAAGSAA